MRGNWRPSTAQDTNCLMTARAAASGPGDGSDHSDPRTSSLLPQRWSCLGISHSEEWVAESKEQVDAAAKTSQSSGRPSCRRRQPTGQTMPAKNEHLHGNAPDKASVALLLIDVINDLEFSEGEQLLPYALSMARQITALKKRSRQAG